MKGIVLAGGRSSRISDITNGGSKCLLKADGKTIIAHNIEQLCALNEIDECIVVVGHNAEKVIYELSNLSIDKKISYCFQKEQKGLINALESAITLIDQNDFFMVLGDEMVLNNNYEKALKSFKDTDVCCLIGIIEVEETDQVRQTYTFKLDKAGRMSSFIEKPQNPYNNYKGTGNVICRKEVLSLLSEIPVDKTRNEKELVGLFNLLLLRHETIGSFVVGESYFNINTAEDYRTMLAYMNKSKFDGNLEKNL